MCVLIKIMFFCKRELGMFFLYQICDVTYIAGFYRGRKKDAWFSFFSKMTNAYTKHLSKRDFFVYQVLAWNNSWMPNQICFHFNELIQCSTIRKRLFSLWIEKGYTNNKEVEFCRVKMKKNEKTVFCIVIVYIQLCRQSTFFSAGLIKFQRISGNFFP